MIGLAIEDFMWFVVNPAVKFSQFNPEYANYYPWLKIGKFKIPAVYIVEILVATLSWYFLWR
jgi:hypothetical protein